MADITIHIENSLHARGFDADERIHHKAFERVKKLIDAQIQKAENHKEANYLNAEDEDKKEDFVRYYNTISIFGERGVGKTSFLMSLRKEYKVVKADKADVDKEDKGIVLLPLIDPTLFEEKGHLFLLIISLIDAEIDAFVKKGIDAEKENVFRKYQSIKCKLAQGLPTLDTEGLTYTEPQWHEDEYMMTRGLESVQAAFDLERNFHHLVNVALQLLGKKAFMLMFDDIDVDFKKGWMVLETLRKFLTTPQLIILLSGNMKLYSKNVRKQQWRNFGKELLLNEMEAGDAGKAEYQRLVNEIEGQYMQKVLKSENRVFLYNIKENILIHGDAYKVSYDEPKPDKGEKQPALKVVTLEQAYQDILNQNGVKGASVIASFTSFLMSASMRTQIHFLYDMHHADSNDLMSKLSAFTSRMYAQHIDVDLLSNARQYLFVFLHYLVEQQLVEEAYQSLPNFESKDINSALTGFTFVFSHLIQSEPSLLFDYWLRIGMSRNHMHSLSYDSREENSIGHYCTGAGIYQSRDLRSVVGNGMAFLASLRQSTPLYEGAVPLLGFSETAKGKGRDLERRIDNVLSKANDVQRALGYLPLITLLYDDRNGRVLHYSFYALLAQIGQILKSADKAGVEEAIRTACVPLNYQVKTYQQQRADDVSEITPEAGIQISENALTQLSSAFQAWKDKYTDLKLTYGNYLFGRISTRLYYALLNIAGNNKKEPLGKVFNLFVAGFINACLIEESRLEQQEHLKGLNINNVSTSVKILVENWAKLNDADLPFTRWMMACPLLYPYLDPAEFPALQAVAGNQQDGEGQDLKAGCMTAVLNQIACLNQKSKVNFSAAKTNIAATVQRINESHLDVNKIIEGEVENAQEELEKEFDKVTKRALNRLREKCQDKDGTLILKPVE